MRFLAQIAELRRELVGLEPRLASLQGCWSNVAERFRRKWTKV